MGMTDRTGQPRGDDEIREAISAVQTVLVKQALELPPLLVVHCGTIIDGLRELLRRRGVAVTSPKAKNTAVVVNCKLDRYDVLCDRSSVFGNPFHIGRHGSRDDVIRLHRAYFYKRVARDADFKALVLSLREQGSDGVVRLGCHCKPLDCHVDTIVGYLNSYDQIEALKESK
jgi:hypothetical protein